MYDNEFMYYLNGALHPTCVGYYLTENDSQNCNSNVQICPPPYAGSQAYELLKALERSNKQHPQ